MPRKYLSIINQITNLELEYFVKRSKSFLDVCYNLGYDQYTKSVKDRIIGLSIDTSHFTSEKIQILLLLNKKYCNKCDTVKNLDNFTNSFTTLYGKSSMCKKCLSKSRKNYSKDYQRNIKYKSSFGITLEQYNEMLENQNNVCAICFQSEKKKDKRLNGKFNNLSIDHCHTTGKIRGLLCNNCNRALGLLQDNSNILQSAIHYLNK